MSSENLFAQIATAKVQRNHQYQGLPIGPATSEYGFAGYDFAEPASICCTSFDKFSLLPASH